MEPKAMKLYMKNYYKTPQGKANIQIKKNLDLKSLIIILMEKENVNVLAVILIF